MCDPHCPLTNYTTALWEYLSRHGFNVQCVETFLENPLSCLKFDANSSCCFFFLRFCLVHINVADRNTAVLKWYWFFSSPLMTLEHAPVYFLYSRVRSDSAVSEHPSRVVMETNFFCVFLLMGNQRAHTQDRSLFSLVLCGVF